MRAFPLAVLPAGPAQVPVLANNYTVQGWEDRPHQYRTHAIPVQKVQGGQVRVVKHPHPRIPPTEEELRFVSVAPPPPPMFP